MGTISERVIREALLEEAAFKQRLREEAIRRSGRKECSRRGAARELVELEDGGGEDEGWERLRGWQGPDLLEPETEDKL